MCQCRRYARTAFDFPKTGGLFPRPSFSSLLRTAAGVRTRYLLSMRTTMVGIWADKWDQQQGISNFIVLPLTFLSGTFYSITRLLDFW